MADSWLIRDGMDRERMLDMDRRIQPLRAAALMVLAAALVISTPWLGVRTILLCMVAVSVAAAFFAIAHRRTEGASNPEYVLFAGWAGSVAIIAVCVAITGGTNSPALAWIAIPVVTLGARFSTRGVVMGVAFVSLMIFAVCAIASPQDTLDDPVYMGASIAMAISIGILSTALMRSDLDHRTRAVIDPLTGLLNRTALHNRTTELTARSHYTAEPVGVIVGDIDHFKQINDTHGHAVGDDVLKDIAYVLRKELRAFDLAYRIGGEEFVVLLPGADLTEAKEFADDLHRVVGASDCGGLRLTMSFGVSASGYGELFNYEEVFARADEALYDAKESGRDRVCVARKEGSHDPAHRVAF